MSDIFLLIHIATTCDEQGVYVTKDTAEVIEIAWSLLDGATLQEIAHDSVLIRPVNTPITALCTSLTTLTWEHVRNAGTFKDAINKIDQFVHEYITSKNLEFTFVTLNSWDLRVQLPREARDKSVVLPPYLQHAKLFDLKQEYSKWQAHHPETLSYSSSNLANIITALEVELNDIKIPFQLNNIQQTPRRASDEVEILSKILAALIKKSKPIEDHPDVLTRPFDARADVCAFLVERSKVLHLSNLPNDTTQSELESWFTQYGGRPIAFWTLKTPDQHKSTSLGFAVFSSHEEAAESLAMNGRSLNDKCIEVQPSSARVLDRAQEILTPFPPSKNRPRPGDWTCPSCGFSNFQRRTACFRCSFPAASAATIQESMYSPNESSTSNNNNVSNNNNNNNMNNPNNGNIHNNNGHYQNQQQLPHQQLQQQQMQQQQMSQQPLSHQQSQPHLNQHHHSNNSTGNNHNNNGNTGRSSSVPFRAGDWKCGNEGCSYHNFAKNICCLRCGTPRVNSSNNLTQQPQQHQQFHSNQFYNDLNSGSNGSVNKLMNNVDGELGVHDLSTKIGGIVINGGN